MRKRDSFRIGTVRVAGITAAWSCFAAVSASQGQEQPPKPSKPPEIQQLRYEEDYSYLRDPATRTDNPLTLEPLKYISLNQGGDWYLSIGGEVRQQYEFYDNLDFGLAPADDGDGYLLQRYVLHADLHAGERLRFFGQLYSAPTADFDIQPSPPDEDNLRVQQAFTDVVLLDSSDHTLNLTLRAGRQEMLYGSQRLVGVREGPNVRRSFDAVRVLGKFGAWQVDGFLSRPVEVDPETFHDWGEEGSTFWGVYATRPLTFIQGAGIDLYYLGLRQNDAEFDQGVADERRHTLGSRLFRENGAWDYNFEAILQFGEFGDGDIFAWSVASDTGYTLENTPLRPRLGLKANVVSGDADPDDADLGTLNPLFPRGNYFGESALVGPANLLNVHPNIGLQLSEKVALEAGWDFYWRYSTDDGVYGPAANLVHASNGSTERYVGSELSLVLKWQINRELSVDTAYSHFFSGSFLKDTGPGNDVNYVSVVLAYRF